MRQALFDTIDDRIHDYYLILSIKAMCRIDCPIALKTDAWNELPGALPAGGIAPRLGCPVTLVEVDKWVVSEAKKNHPELTIVEGDIRSLPFENGQFNLILDLSTLDHIPEEDVSKVLSEYSRVMKPGYLVLVTWFVEPSGVTKVPTDGEDEWQPTRQYLFEYEKTKRELKKHFTLEEEETLFAAPDRYLHYMLLEKH